MKSVTDYFEEQQKQASATIIRQVYYKRRYWNAASKVFSWESSWTELEQNELQSVSPVLWSLDTDQLNEFKVSNVTIQADNSFNQWRVDNSDGIFGIDSSSNLHPYEPFWTKFQIKAGFELADGTTETVSVFTGVATDYIFNAQSKTVQITVQGLEALLVGTKAEAIATTVTEENAGSGNGVTTAFTTLNPGVGGISEVSVSGIKKLEGSDYTVSNLNSSSLGASATFAVAPASGTVRISYFYWPQNQKFETLVAALVTAAGISGGNQSIQPVLFSNSVINSFTYTTQADFVAGVKTDIDTTLVAGQLRIDFSTSTQRQSTTWSTSTSGWTSTVSTTGTFTSDGTYLTLATGASGGVATAYRAMAKSSGNWQFLYTFSHTNSFLSFVFNTNDTGSGTSLPTSAWQLQLDGPNSRIALLYNGSVIVSSGVTFDTSEHTILVVYNGSYIVVYHDGVAIINQETVGSWYSAGFLHLRTAGVASRTVKVRQIYIPADTLTASWVSTVADSSSTPTAWGSFGYTNNQGSGTVTYQTATSTDNVSYDAYATVVAGAPQSTLRRYTKVKVLLSLSSSAAVTSDPDIGNFVDVPYVDDVVLRTTTSSTLVTMPNFTGSDVYEAIQKLGEYTNYEFGFTPEEVFFFRAKTPGVSVLELNESNYVSSVNSLDSGYQRVYGVARVTYGSITKEITDSGQNPESASARFKNRRYELSPDSNIVIPATADIATGVAQSLFAYVSKPRRRAKVVTHFLPQLDLSDVITVTLTNNWPDKVWYIGDDNTDIYIGNMGLDLWGDGDQFLSSFEGKIINARYDTNQHSCEFEVEEIL